MRKNVTGFRIDHRARHEGGQEVRGWCIGATWPREGGEEVRGGCIGAGLAAEVNGLSAASHDVICQYVSGLICFDF